MKTQIIDVSAAWDDETLLPAAQLLRTGGLVAFPTETVYGLGCSALDGDAARRVYEAKGRPSDNPLIVHISALSDAEAICEPTDLFLRLAALFWPGPFTMIVKKKPCIPPSVTGGLDTVAVRFPSDPVAHRLLSLCGVPVAAPSANLSGKPSPTCAEHVIRDLNGRVDMILAGGPCAVGLESTVVRLDGENLMLLRPGAVTREMLEDAIGPENVFMDPVVTEKVTDVLRPQSPGMKYRHYAPTAPVVLLHGTDAAVLSYMKTKQAESPFTGILCYDEDEPSLRGALTRTLGRRDDRAAQAHRLFACLRAFDDTDAAVIYAPLPSKEGIGLAVYNRLAKAAGFTILKIE